MHPAGPPQRTRSITFQDDACYTYQKIICKITKATPTTTAQNAGLCHIGRSPSEGIVVAPGTSPASSLSGLGFVTRLTVTVTNTQITADHSARNMFSAMSFAWLESAMYCSAPGSALTHAHIAIEEAVPEARPQNPPAFVARFHSMPSSTVPNSGAMKKLNSACT